MKKQLHIILLFLFCLPLYLNCQNQYFPELEKEQSDLEKILFKKYKKLYGKKNIKQNNSILFIYNLSIKKEIFTQKMIYRYRTIGPDELVNVLQHNDLLSILEPEYSNSKVNGKYPKSFSFIMYDDSLNIPLTGYEFLVYKNFQRYTKDEFIVRYLLQKQADFVFQLIGPVDFYYYVKDNEVFAFQVLKNESGYYCQPVDLKDKDALFKYLDLVSLSKSKKIDKNE